MVWKRTHSLIAALLVPLLVQTMFLVLSKSFHQQVFGGEIAPLIPCVLGFVFLAREYRWYSLIGALVYFPAMYFLLFGFSLSFAGMVYGDFL